MNQRKASSKSDPDLPKKRWLFAVNVNATGRVIYSVAGDTEKQAFNSLVDGDRGTTVLVYDDIEIKPPDKPTPPEALGIDHIYAKRSRYAQ